MFELAVVISAVDQFTGPITKMMKQMGLMKQQTEATQKQLNQFKTMAVVGGVITGVGAAMADGLVKAAEKAGELQQAVVGVGTAMKATQSQMQQLNNMSMTLGVPTRFSSVETSKILGAMYTAGLPKDQVLNSDIAKQYINFADVQAYVKKENPEEAVSNAVTMAHQYQLYSPQQISPFLNNLNAILLQSHQTMSEFATQYNYVAAQAKRSGLSATDALDVTALLARIGFGSGRGGTNFADFLARSYYHSSGSKADAAMEQAGFVKNGHSVFYDAKGNFVGIPQAAAIMQDFYKRYGGDMNKINPILNAIYGVQGGRFAGSLMSPGTVDQWNMIQKNRSSTADIDTMQKAMNMTFGGQAQQAKTTMEDLVQVFGQQLLPILTVVLSKINDVTGKILEFALAHPEVVKMAAVFATVATAVALVIGPFMILVGAIGYLSKMQILQAGFSILSRSLIGMLGPFAIFAGIALLIYENWGTLEPYFKRIGEALLPKLESAFTSIGNEAKKAAQFIKDNWGNIQPFVLGIVGAWAAYAVVMGTVRGAQMIMTAAQWALNVAMDANPVGIIITLLGLLAGALIWAATHWDIVRQKAEQVWASFKNNPILWLIGGPFSMLIVAMASIITNWDLIPIKFQDGWATIRNAFISGVNDVVAQVNKLVDAWNYVTGMNVQHLNGVGGKVMTDAIAAQRGLTDNQARRAFGMVNGSHAAGLGYVPFDGYIAELHRGEMVLTAQQAASLRGSRASISVVNTMNKVGGGGGNVTINIQAGAIQINGADKQSSDIVDEIFNRLGPRTRQLNMSRPFGPNRQVF